MKTFPTFSILFLLLPFLLTSCEPTIEKVDGMTDQGDLAEVARTAANGNVREAAVEKLTDQKALFEIATNEISLSEPEEGASKLSVCILAAEYLTDKNLSISVAQNKFLNSEIRVAAISSLKDPRVLDGLFKNYYNISEEVEEALVFLIEEMADEDELTDAATNLNNEAARLAAVEKITNQETLASIAESDLAPDVRNAAFEKLTDQELLTEFAMASMDPLLGVAAVKKIADQKLLLDVVLVDEVDYLVRREAVNILADKLGEIKDQEVLGGIALYTDNPNVRDEAIKKITDQRILGDIALKKCDAPKKTEKGMIAFESARAAVKRLNNQKLLVAVAQNNSFREIREAAVKKLRKQKALATVALNNTHPDIRMKAAKKLRDRKSLAVMAVKDPEEENRDFAATLLLRMDLSLPLKAYHMFPKCRDVNTRNMVRVKQTLLEPLLVEHYGPMKFRYGFSKPTRHNYSGYKKSGKLKYENVTIKIRNKKNKVVFKQNYSVPPDFTEETDKLCASINLDKIGLKLLKPLGPEKIRAVLDNTNNENLQNAAKSLLGE